MIIRKSGMYYGVHNDRLYPIVAWHFYVGTCVLAEPGEPYDYYCDPWLPHYLLQDEAGSVTDGRID